MPLSGRAQKAVSSPLVPPVQAARIRIRAARLGGGHHVAVVRPRLLRALLPCRRTWNPNRPTPALPEREQRESESKTVTSFYKIVAWSLAICPEERREPVRGGQMPRDGVFVISTYERQPPNAVVVTLERLDFATPMHGTPQSGRRVAPRIPNSGVTPEQVVAGAGVHRNSAATAQPSEPTGRAFSSLPKRPAQAQVSRNAYRLRRRCVLEWRNQRRLRS